MRKTEEEKNLLAKLASGVLDGMVGDERVYRGYKNIYCAIYFIYRGSYLVHCQNGQR